MRAGVLAVGACLLLAACGGKKAEPPPVVVDRQTATGRHATVTASADATHYTGFSVEVSAAPSQRVTGGWVISCRQGTASSRDSQDFGGRTPLTLSTSPTYGPGCTVVATATLTRSGRVTVKLLGAQ